MKRLFVFLISGVFLLLSAAAPLFAQPAAKSLVDNECSKCHDTKRVYSSNKKAGEWEKTVDRMIKKGAKIKPEEKDAVIKYLNTLNK
jgi:ribosomal protein L17